MKRAADFLAAWARTCLWPAAALLTATAVFVGLHLLGGGAMRELTYALTVLALLAAAGIVVSMRRLYTRRRALAQALTHLPEEPGALPAADTPTERQWRALAEKYQRETKRRGDAFLQDAREKTDYYTLWLHQIKTPLAALQLMAQSRLPVDRELMRQELVKIEQYAGAALSFQRLQSLHEDLNLSRTALYPVCCQVARKLRPLFSYGQISLTLEPFDGAALTDSKWVAEVLTQVMTNALKYTPPGGSITVAMPEDGVLTVRDTGIGIRPEDIHRVFDRGFTGWTGRSHEKSTGIGLYLCKRICDELGHRISLASAVGKGTEVTLDMRRSEFTPMS